MPDAPVLVAATNYSGSASISATIDPAIQQGDFLLLLVQSFTSTVGTSLAGWTLGADVIRGTGTSHGLYFWKIAGASETAPTVTFGTSQTNPPHIARMEAWRGVDTQNPLNAVSFANSSAASAGKTQAAVTTTKDQCAIVYYDTTAASSAFTYSWSGATENSDFHAKPSTNDHGLSTASAVQATAGTTPSVTSTASSSIGNRILGTFALKPSGPYDKAAADTWTVTEAASKITGVTKTAADTWTMTDAAQPASKEKTAADTWTMTDAATAEVTELPPEPYSPDLPFSPEPVGIGRAGGDYRVHFHDKDGVTVADLDMQDITSLKWGRALSEVSRCQLDGTTASSPEVAQRVRPWVHWVSVYRGSEFVWRGLVTDTAARSRTWTVMVKDVSTLMWRTRVPMTRTWRDTDPLQIGADLWDAMIAFQGVPAGRARRLTSTVAYTIDVVQDRRMVHQAMEDVVGLGAEWTVIGSLAIFEPSLRTPDLELSHTRLSDCDFESELEVVHDGSRFFNDTRLQGKNYASTALVEVAGLRMQNLISMDNLFGEGNITRAAAQSVAKTGKPRTAIIVPAGANLTVSAPVTIAELVPGVVIPVWTDVGGGVQDYLRLESMEVTIDAGIEKVAVTLGEIPDVTEVGVTV